MSITIDGVFYDTISPLGWKWGYFSSTPGERSLAAINFIG